MAEDEITWNHTKTGTYTVKSGDVWLIQTREGNTHPNHVAKQGRSSRCY